MKKGKNQVAVNDYLILLQSVFMPGVARAGVCLYIMFHLIYHLNEAIIKKQSFLKMKPGFHFQMSCIPQEFF